VYRWTIAFALALTLGASTDAWAGKSKTTETTAAATPTYEPVEMATTNIPSFDTFFDTAEAPLNTLIDIHKNLDTAQANLNTSLGLTAGTPFATALADLKAKAEGKITVAMDSQAMPTLSAAEGMPANVQTSLDAFNASIAAINTAVGQIATLTPQIVTLAGQVPPLIASAPTEAKNAGLSVTKIPSAVSAAKNNGDLILAGQTAVTATATAIATMSTDVKAAFSN
jgi:hypothetical protein